MTIPQNIQVLADHFVMPVKVLSYDEEFAVVLVPGKKEYQVKAALEKLRAEKKIDQGSIRYMDKSPGVRYRKYRKHKVGLPDIESLVIANVGRCNA